VLQITQNANTAECSPLLLHWLLEEDRLYVTYFERYWPVHQVHVNVVKVEGGKAGPQCWHYILPPVTVTPQLQHIIHSIIVNQSTNEHHRRGMWATHCAPLLYTTSAVTQSLIIYHLLNHQQKHTWSPLYCSGLRPWSSSLVLGSAHVEDTISRRTSSIGLRQFTGNTQRCCKRLLQIQLQHGNVIITSCTVFDS